MTSTSQTTSRTTSGENPESGSRAAKRTLTEAAMHSRAIVCAGTGGVGKTTISAAIAVGAALSGRRTLVLTIDPARRLADAFGLDALGSEPTPVDLSRLGSSRSRRTTRSASGSAGKSASEAAVGLLDAMMLDPKPTFDALVDRFAEDETTRRRILDNPLYQHLSETLAGSTEYAAMVQVHELVEAGHYDLIVVDTPPADHALDFLRAPRRMREFLEGRFVRTLVQPAFSATRFGARLVGRGLKRVLSLIDRVAGGGFIEDVTEFMAAVDGLSLGFEEKSRRVESFLLGPETSFVLVSGVQPRSMRGALDFLSKLEEFEVPLAAVVINRMRPWIFDALPSESDFRMQQPAVARDARTISKQLGIDGIGEQVVLQLAEYATLCAGQNASAEALEKESARRDVECRRVPEFERDLDQLEGLVSMAEALGARAGA